ncbi:MAG: ABC transporter permease subunit [Erysipelotrichaceae bacterium]|nr:ABC transporter permease subunit [Erysipelotrichaceae bacterium]
MINLIRSDLYRIFKCKAIYVLIIVIIFISLTSVVLMEPFSVGISVSTNTNNTNGVELTNELEEADSLGEYRRIMKEEGAFALDKEIIGYNINMYYVFIVLVVLAITTDFSNKSIKNSLSSAISRKEYYLSKLILTLLLGTCFIFFNNYISYILNYFINGKGFYSQLTDITKITLIQLPMLYGIISFLVSLAFLLRKTSTFNTITIPFIMLFQIICSGIIGVLRINTDFYMNYELQNALTNLASNPSLKYILYCFILGVLYMLIFNVIGYLSFKKAEIK